MARLVAVVALLGLTTSACSWETRESTTPTSLPFVDETSLTTTSSSSTTTMAPASCVGASYSVNYPDTWYSADRSSTEQCFWFGSAPIGADIAEDFVPEITIVTERRYRDALARLTNFNDTDYKLVNSSAINVNGYPATLFDIITSDPDSPNPTEAQSRLVIVDVKGKAITMRATEATVAIRGEGVDYSETLHALDMVMNSLIIPR